MSCGLPEAQPTWIDFADSSVSFWRERFARPGVVVATGGPELAAEARAAGAGTVHWDMYLRKRVGTPSEPADPALIEKRADSLFDYAVSVSGCQTPLIALNELWGASLPTPLTPTAERYRANVLRFVTQARGAWRTDRRSSSPASRSRAATQRRGGSPSAAVSDLVLENYANANLIWRDGPVDGSRRLRVRHRQSAAKLLALGIPPSRIGIMIGFQTGPGTGGREGLAAALALVQRREVADARREAGREGAAARARLVVGLGAARRAIERPGQDVRRVRLAVGARRESLRRTGDPRPRARSPTRRRASSTCRAGRAACTARRR